MRGNERENFSNDISGNDYIDEDLQKAMDEFTAFYGDENDPRGTVEEDQEKDTQTAFYEASDSWMEEEGFGGIGMGTVYKSDIKAVSGRHGKKRKGLFVFAGCLAFVVLCSVVLGTAYMLKEKKDDADQEKEAMAAITATETPTTQAATTEEKYDGWIADAKVIQPVKTENTISLPAADFSVFEVPEKEEGETEEKDEEEYDPWTLVTLNLDSVEGSINRTSPGEPDKTTQLTSTYMVLVDLDTEEIVAERECEKVIVPASMTKILTVITARDYVSEENLDDTFVITQDIVDEAERSGLSAVGFKPGDTVTVRDLLYGTIVCSGADAAMGLATYCCGSQEAFVERMNENVEQLGLSGTAHFTNPVGKYEEDLHCTMTDMAVILNVAMQDELLRDVLSTRIYHTDIKYPDLEPPIPDGIEISNWFLRRIEDKEMAGNVIGAKTGFVNQSGFCSASYYEANDGKRYICVTGNANNSWRAIYDHVGVYRSFTR